MVTSTDGSQQGWRVTIVVDVDPDIAHTPRDAALAAWGGIQHDYPPIVTVQPADTAPGTTVTIDLSETDS